MRQIPLIGVTLLILTVVEGLASNGAWAQAAPPSPVPSLKAMLDEVGFAMVQPDKTKSQFRVTVESGGLATVVYCAENVVGWKRKDGSAIVNAYLSAQLVPWNAKDVEITPELTRALAETNDNISWSCLSLYVDSKTGEWTIFVKTDVFLNNISAEGLSDHLYLINDAVQKHRSRFVAFVEAGRSSGAK